MWQTVKEIAKEAGMSDRATRKFVAKMVDIGEFEYRFRKEPHHYTREYRRKKSK